MESVLILGAGQIGTFAARALEQGGHHVVVADAAPSFGYYSRFGPRNATSPLNLDAFDECSVKRALLDHEITSVVNCAGHNSSTFNRDIPNTMRVNSLLPSAILKACDQTHVTRMTHVSSRAVYEPSAAPCITETHSKGPRSSYGRAILAGEKRLLETRDAIGRLPNLVILRSSGLFGPVRYQTGSHSARLLDDLQAAARTGCRVLISATSSTVDEYLYVKDLATAIVKSIESSCGCEVINVGPGTVTSAQDLVRAFSAVTSGWQFAIRSEADQDTLPLRPLCIDKAFRLLGFRPQFDLQEGLADYLDEIEWHIGTE